jgi:glutamate-1-semialdehyde 2,1-aminomutase
VAMAAGLATLDIISAPDFFPRLAAMTQRLTDGLQERAAAAGIPFTTNRVGGMFGLFFTDQPHVRSYADVLRCDVERFKRFFHGMIAEGVYLAPSAFEAGFVSAAHTDREIDATIAAAARVFARL